MKHWLERASLRVLPKRLLTSVVGSLSRTKLSKRAIPIYIRHYNIDYSDAERNLEDYSTLVEFFARGLRAGARSIAETGVISPVDGTVSECGVIRDGLLLQAKGDAYSLSSLVADDDMAARYRNGFYVTIYLSPRDYHRIHIPVSGTMTSWRYIPGALYPVNPKGVRHIRGLFTKNERLVTEIDATIGKYVLVKVGATIVGSIRTEYGPSHMGPYRRHRVGICGGVLNTDVTRGEEVGRFEFGSTVILLFEPDMVTTCHVVPGDTVRMGQCIAELRM